MTLHIKAALHIFGEVLFDYFPDGRRVLGGAPFNVAWHLQAFGQPAQFISRVGDDTPGHEIIDLMTAWGMGCDALQTDNEHPTGSVSIQFCDGEPHYDIVANCAYDFIDAKHLDLQQTQGILYHGSLALRNPVSYGALQLLKARHVGKILVDVNLRPPWWQPEMLMALLQNADWVKLNADELLTLCPGYTDLQATMLAFCAQFNLEALVVTLGAQGAIVCDKQQRFITAKPPANTIVVDTVGAGDSFTAVLLLGLIKQWPLQQTLDRAQAFAAAIVGQQGATVADREFYRAFVEQWAAPV